MFSNKKEREDKVTVTFEPTETKELDVAHLVRLSKDSERELNEKITKKHLDAIVAGVNTPQRVRQGWKVELVMATTYSFWKREYNMGQGDSVYTYFVTLKVTCTPDKERNLDAEFVNIVNAIEMKAKFPGKWEISTVDAEDWKARKAQIQENREQVENTDIGYAPFNMPEEFETNFEHLYGLDAHISRVKRAILGTLRTGYKKRLHCVLIGPPGCGKSDILRSMKQAFGEDAVLEFDATSTTAAGALKELDEREELPRFLFVEEIEKADDKSLQWLLGLMDLRGEIRKTTARKNIQRDTKMICVATVNDVPTFEKLAFGALASRFSNKIYFQRPSRELLGRILEREVKAIKGNMEWINATLDLADEIDTTDPREVISLMLCGQDALLDGTFQQEYKWTSPPIPVKEERKNGVVA
jgi:energy-coupling factor transporter ATP-binding protein EcfA2